MKSIWFISDTHFDHANILKFTGDDGLRIRPKFDSVEQMNQCMVDNWNSVVKPGDHVWHLGDFAMGNRTISHRIIGGLNGHKCLCVGNHDNVKEIAPSFDEVVLWRIFKEHNFVCTHVPLHPSQMYKVQFNVHGHIHQNLMVEQCYINICVEHTNYAPVHLDEILKTIKERS